MKNLLLILFLSFGLSGASFLSAQQKYYTSSGTIHFLSKALIEDIEATNNEVICLVDISTKEMAFKVPIKKFKFEKSLMEEHFNENYMESDKYPYATFSGSIANLSDIDIVRNQKFSVQVEGDLTIHGVTQHITEKGEVEVLDGKLYLRSEFIVKLEDYSVKIPKLMFQNIAEKLTVTVKAELTEYAK